MKRVTMTSKERERLVDLAKTITAWLIDTGRAIKNGGMENREAALSHAESIVDAVERLTPEDK